MYNVFCRQANSVESEAIAFSVFKVSKLLLRFKADEPKVKALLADN